MAEPFEPAHPPNPISKTKAECLQIAERNQVSPLLCLPPETRNSIYAYVLTNQYTIDPSREGGIRIYSSQPTNALALICTNRRIFSECALLPFALGRFVISYTRDPFSPLLLSKFTQQQCGAIRNLHIDTAWRYSSRMSAHRDLPFLDRLTGLKQVTLISRARTVFDWPMRARYAADMQAEEDDIMQMIGDYLGGRGVDFKAKRGS